MSSISKDQEYLENIFAKDFFLNLSERKIIQPKDLLAIDELGHSGEEFGEQASLIYNRMKDRNETSD